MEVDARALETVDDRFLVARANGGDRAAFDALYQRHKGWVLALAWKLTGSEADALDVLQESFVYFFGRFPGFELTGALRSYLFPLVKHQAISLMRRRRRSVSLEAEEEAGRPEAEPSFQPAPDHDLEVRLQSLSPGHRQVVHQRFVLGMKLEEIAEALEIPPGTVKSRLHHALRKLREREEAEDASLERGPP
ncbi:MAG: RNA polymerase sigma factor [Deltaproteobacteria bacterium]|nr:RNA polymerase sigma factor [Deltaproteobacteria bacterium]